MGGGWGGGMKEDVGGNRLESGSERGLWDRGGWGGRKKRW